MNCSKCCHVNDFKLKGPHVALFTIYSLKYRMVHRLERHTFIKRVSIKTKTHLSKKEKKHKPKIPNAVFPIAHSNFRFSSFKFSLFRFLLNFLNTYACDTERERRKKILRYRDEETVRAVGHHQHFPATICSLARIIPLEPTPVTQRCT